MSTFPAPIYPIVPFNLIITSCLLHIFSGLSLELPYFRPTGKDSAQVPRVLPELYQPQAYTLQHVEKQKLSFNTMVP